MAKGRIGMSHRRLIVITPPAPDPDSAGSALEQALDAAENRIAAVIVAAGSGGDEALDAARTLVPVIQAHGAAALVLDDIRAAERSGADGVHVETGIDDIAAAIASARRERIIGAGNLGSRHAAMVAAESGVDYVFFGRHDGDTHPEPNPRLLDLASWWAELMTVPVIALAGKGVAGIAAAASSGAEFVAVGRFIWEHPEGPAAALRAASAILSEAATAPPPDRVGAPA